MDFLRLGTTKTKVEKKKGNDGNALRLPPKVEDTIGQLLPSEDVLDRPEFDAREFINRNFPDEQSLGDISSFLTRLRVRMKELDDSLSQASQEQSLAAHQAVADLKEAKAAVQQLYHKIQDIRGKAEHSEVMVQEICRDIKQLDYAKRHLQTTLTSLKRLHMLVHAVDQLELVASQRNYKEAATLMEAVNQLFTHFDAYSNVSKIVELHNTVRGLQEELSAQIFADFASVGPLDKLEDNFGTNDERMAVCSNLSAACQVVEALGKPVRDKLIQSYCHEQLQSYDKQFGTNGECTGLSHAEQRYPWFYHLIQTLEERIDLVFPKHWRMTRRLCIYFCELTRTHFLTQIGTLAPDEIDVTFLLKALQRTLMFERDVADRFEGSNGNGTENEEEYDEQGQLIDPHSAEGIKRRHRRKKREAERKALEAEMDKRGDLFASGTVDDTFVPLRGIISKSFDPFMTSYVSLERKNMEQMIHEVMSQEIVDRNGNLPVFSSSVNMFAYIRNSVKRCLALTNGQTFFNLHNEFKHCFQLYAQRLLTKLPTSNSNPTVEGTTSVSRVKLGDKQEEELCFVINTAEYCAETLPSLEEVIRGKIDKAFAEAIELSQEIDMFHDVGATAMKCIVSGLETMLEEELMTIQKMNWQTWEAVGDESPYVLQIGEKLHSFVPILRQMLSGLYFTNFYDKFAASFVPKILQAVLRCRKVNEVATQQLLLDVYALKTLFLQLPVINETSQSTSSVVISSRYTKFVTHEIGKVENVLKLIGTPNEMLVESFKIMWPEGNAEDFQKILNVKGVKKSEQGGYLETLGMQRSRPSGMMAEMEGKMTDMTGKMTDMTGNLKKGMQNFAKVPFTFN